MRHIRLYRFQVIVEDAIEGVLSSRAGHQQSHPGPGNLIVEAFDDLERVLDIRAAPSGPWFCDLEVSSRCGSASTHANTSRWHVQDLAGLMFGKDPRDVVVDYNDLVSLTVPLLGKDADRRRTAADTHPLLFNPVDHRRLARLHDQAGAVVDRQFDRLLVAQRLHDAAGDIAFFLGAARQMIDAAKREHLGAVFRGCQMSHVFAFRAYRRCFRTDVAVGVDLHFHAAIAENPLGHHGDSVDAFVVARDDEGCWFVIRICRARPDTGDEDIRAGDRIAVPVRLIGEERYYFAALLAGPLGEDQRIRAD